MDLTKLNMIAQEWDPEPFLRALDEAAVAPPQGPAMADPNAAPGAAPPAGGMDFASLFGGQAPGGMPMQQDMPQPGVNPNMPQGAAMNLAQLLGGR